MSTVWTSKELLSERRRVFWEVYKVPAGGEEHECRELNCFYSKENHITGDKKNDKEGKMITSPTRLWSFCKNV